MCKLLGFPILKFSWILLKKIVIKILYRQSRYEKYHVYYGGAEEDRKANYSDMVREDQVPNFFL